MSEKLQAISAVSNTLVCLAAVAITVYTLRTFLSFRRTAKYVYFATFIGYFCSIVLLFLIPLDIGVTSYLSCENITNASKAVNVHFDATGMVSNTGNQTSCQRPYNFIDPKALTIIWAVLYWVTYVATWVIYPCMQSYVLSGEFTVWGRVKAALKENLLFAGVAIVVVGVLYAVLKFGFPQSASGIIEAAITAGSMWGIFVLIGLLSYGLIFVPRKYWRKANVEQSIQHLQSKLAGYYDELEDYGYTLDQTLKVVRKYDETVPESHESRHYIDQIIKSAPEEYVDITAGGEAPMEFSELVNLNAKLQWDLYQYRTSKVLFEQTFKQAVTLEEIKEARAAGWQKRVDYSMREPFTGCCAPVYETWDWIWTLIFPWWFRFIAIIFAFMSATLIYSEVIFVHWPQHSFYAVIVRNIEELHPALNQSICFVMVSYLAVCTYSALFKLKLFWFYRLLPHQQTDENSILFSAAYLSRLVAPLYLNFLHLIDFTQTPVPSPFVAFMKDDPIRTALYKYFPIFLVLLCIFTLFNLGNKIMKLCGLNQVCCTDDFDDDQIERGSEILFREREANVRGTTTIKGIGPKRVTTGARRDQAPPRGDSSKKNEPKESTSTSNANDKHTELVLLEDDEEMARNIITVTQEPTAIQSLFGWFGALVSPSSATINATQASPIRSRDANIRSRDANIRSRDKHGGSKLR